ASGCSNYVDYVAFADARSNCIPMCVIGAGRDWDAGTQSKLFSPLRREIASDTSRAREAALNARSHAREQRINFDEEVFRRQATQLRVPHPFVAHGANAARNFLGCANAA